MLSLRYHLLKPNIQNYLDLVKFAVVADLWQTLADLHGEPVIATRSKLIGDQRKRARVRWIGVSTLETC